MKKVFWVTFLPSWKEKPFYEEVNGSNRSTQGELQTSMWTILSTTAQTDVDLPTKTTRMRHFALRLGATSTICTNAELPEDELTAVPRLSQ
jgi:hypothetical protein